jgi:hypothetical protein
VIKCFNCKKRTVESLNSWIFLQFGWPITFFCLKSLRLVEWFGENFLNSGDFLPWLISHKKFSVDFFLIHSIPVIRHIVGTGSTVPYNGVCLILGLNFKEFDKVESKILCLIFCALYWVVVYHKFDLSQTKILKCALNRVCLITGVDCITFTT